MFRRISHASHGSFNPYVISNKEAHIINGSVFVGLQEKAHKATTSSGQSQEETNDREHFINYCLTYPGKFSCAVDCFVELNFAFFKDSLKHINQNEFFEILFQACLHLENYDEKIDLTINHLGIFKTTLQLIC